MRKTHKSKIIVPAFAVGRTQDLVMRIKQLVAERACRSNSHLYRLTLRKATEVFRRIRECYDDETYKLSRET